MNKKAVLPTVLSAIHTIVTATTHHISPRDRVLGRAAEFDKTWEKNYKPGYGYQLQRFISFKVDTISFGTVYRKPHTYNCILILKNVSVGREKKTSQFFNH